MCSRINYSNCLPVCRYICMRGHVFAFVGACDEESGADGSTVLRCTLLN